MYSRSTERRGRTHLPPGYDGNAFRHDTGERRSLGDYPTETKVHSPWKTQETMEAEASPATPAISIGHDVDAALEIAEAPGGVPKVDSFLSGMLDSLGKEEWLLFFLLLLLLADGSDAWELILLLAVLLAVR